MKMKINKYHYINRSLINRLTASSFLCNKTYKMFRLISTYPSPVNYFKSAKSTRFKAYKNIFDFYCFVRNSDSALRLFI